MRPLRLLAVVDAAVAVAGVVALVAHLAAVPADKPVAPQARTRSPAATAGDAPASAPTTTVPKAPRPAAVGLLALRPADPASANLTRYGVVILNAWEWERIAALKQAYPDTTVLVYKDMASTRSYAVDGHGNDQPLIPTGIGYAAAARDHGDWFLHDQRGRRIEWAGYGGHWWMDVGNRAYEDAWLAAVRAELGDHGWDGAFIDNAIVNPDVYLPSGARLPSYAAPEDYQRATEQFLTTVSGPLRAEGKVVVTNLGGAMPSLDLYQRWASITGGVMREHFARWGSDGKGALLSSEEWRIQADQQAAAAAAGARYLAVTYSPPDGPDFLRFARASFLIGWNGDAKDALMLVDPTPGHDPWAPVWTADIGTPSEARRPVGDGWVRRFSAGIAAVNPGGIDLDVPLDGAYVDDIGKLVTSVRLGPHQGAVLHVAGTAG